MLAGEEGALCMECADLDHLLFLPAGHWAVTRRARQYSTLWAVVLKWSPNRQLYIRQGLLVEARGLEQAEAECLADREVRERRRAREADRREAVDRQYMHQFAAEVRALFPGCPSRRVREIAVHAGLKFSGQFRQAVAVKVVDPEAVRVAVMAHVRHRETPYDELLMQRYDCTAARAAVEEGVRQVLQKWEAQR